MAKVSDFDTKAVVNRYLQRQVITPTTDDEADREEEVTAVLESVAVSFQQEPQLGLAMVSRAKNTLRQIVQKDIELIDFLINAIGDINNPDITVADLSDLVEAQTALLELDRLQRVDTDLKAFKRYRSSVDRFLDNQLAPSLKRRAKKEFERDGLEAKADLFRVLPRFGPTHGVMQDRLRKLAGAVDDFRSVSLDRLVSQRTLRKVRGTLQDIKNRFEGRRTAISKTTAAVELLGGAAAMETVSTTVDILDPTIRTGEFPSNRTITIRSELVSRATALSSQGPWTLGATPWDFQMTLNSLSATPVTVDEELPAVGHEGKVYVVADPIASSGSYDIPADGTLYILAEGASVEEQEIKLTTTGAAVPLTTVIAELNASLVDVVAAEWGNTGRIAFFGDAGVVSSVVIRGEASGIVGNSAAVGGIIFTSTPLNGETVVIGSRTYTFETAFTDTPDFVLIGGSIASAISNLVAAINNGAGEGAVYGTGTAAHADVTAAVSATTDAMDIVAQTPGTSGNAIVLSETMTNGYWTTPTMVGGGSPIFNTDPSIHDVLGFNINEHSLPLGQFTASSLKDALEYRVTGATFAVEGNYLRITSNLQDPQTSSLRFDGGVEADFGYVDLAETTPSYMILTENNTDLDAAGLGVFIGSTVSAAEPLIPGSSRRALNNQAITSIDGEKLYFDEAVLLPRGEYLDVTVQAPIVTASVGMKRDLDPLVGSFDSDYFQLQQKMSPLLGKPTAAQINDALRLLRKIRKKLVRVRDALDAMVVRDDRNGSKRRADRIIEALEQRGLDRAKDLLSTGEFTKFFDLDKTNASRGNRFMTAMSSVVNNDLPLTTIESDMADDDRPSGENPDDNILDDRESLADDILVRTFR